MKGPSTNRTFVTTPDASGAMPEAYAVIDGGQVAPVVTPANITSKFREAFEKFEPNGNRWQVSLGPGDIVMLDGNAAAASYLVISKDPLSVGGETVVETKSCFTMPFDIAIGVSASQRTLGQEFAIEAVSLERTSALDDLQISSISQTGTSLIVTTATPHNLSPGRRVGIYGVSDPRLNYPSLVVQTIPAPNQFACAAGPMGAIPSLTVGPLTGGFVYYRSALGYAENGASLILEQASATTASLFVRSESGDVMPSGTITGNQGVTIGSTASVPLVSAANTYAFQPTCEYRVSVMADKLQFSDCLVDSLNSASARLTRTQVVPDPEATYKFRVRAVNNKGYSVPNAKVISAVKSGSSTATITTDIPHGYTTSDVVLLWGQRDQTSFAATASPVAIASVISPTQFTVAYGASVTASTSGGFVARCNGGNTALGFISQAVQSAQVVSGVLVLTGSANWSGLAIGDYVNAHGLRDAGNGADIGIDGAYRVRNVSTTVLELEPIGGTVIPANMALVNCGGAIIKRTDLRISYVRIFDYERQRVEIAPRPISDNNSSVPVVVNNNLSVAGTTGIDSNVPSPVALGGRASNVNPTAVGAAGRLQHMLLSMIGAVITKPYCLPESEWVTSLSLTTAADVQVVAAAGAGIRNHVTYFWAMNTSATPVDLIIKDGTTERLRYPLVPNVPTPVEFPTGMPTTANTILNVALSAAVTAVRLNMHGYRAP